MPLPEERETLIRTTLKRCSSDVIAAALRYPESLDDADLHTLVMGVLERDLPEDRAAKLPAATDDSRIIEDIGMDSFGMIDVVMTAEEVLGIAVGNDEMRSVKTLGELKDFLKAKTQAAATTV